MSLVIVDRYWAARMCQAYHQTDFPFHLTVHFVSSLARSGRGWKYEFKCRHVNVARRLSAARPRTRRCAPGLGCACARPATPGARRPSGTFMNTMGTYLAAISHQAGRGRAGLGRRAALHRDDGWAGLGRALPPLPRQCQSHHHQPLVTADPSYNLKCYLKKDENLIVSR